MAYVNSFGCLIEEDENMPLGRQDWYTEPKVEMPPPPPIPTECKKNKARWDLLPFAALELAAEVMAFGVDKHQDDGAERWRTLRQRDHFASLMRHISSYWRGEWLDPETKKPHLAHALCRMAFLLAMGERSE